MTRSEYFIVNLLRCDVVHCNRLSNRRLVPDHFSHKSVIDELEVGSG